jgi:hypothetical protein
MKRFLVFAYDAYYPSGGWSDFQSAHDTLDEAKAAKKALNEPRRKWYYVDIVDLENMAQVFDE